ncbi:hypothetical protein H4R18_000151 [Coemansia javaensis]|uniref:Uncharacterized protein n=1 Tax=Coemansia javaensis TaxID=2761396 RepID=A0A9W8HHR3_9FUNG|nr:hypothetical protein H4R18_000151 [Coemansia javaensis]
MSAEITKTRPYFRFKRGTLTLFVEARAAEKLHAVAVRLASALQAHGGEDVFAAVTPDEIRLLVPDPPPASAQYRVLDPAVRVDASGLEDDAVVYFALLRSDGTWEEPYAMDYDADMQDMDVSA